jgi:predicted Zn-dependent peptidase
MPRHGDPDWAAAKLLNAYLNRAAPRLRAALNEGDQQVAWVAAGFDETVGLIGIVARLGPGTDPEAILERLAPLADRAVESVDPQVFANVRDRLRLSEASRISSVSSRAWALGRAHLRRGDYSAYHDDQRALATSEPIDVASLAASHLHPDRAVTLIVGPAAAGQASTTGDPEPSASGQSAPSATGNKEIQ